MEYLELEGYSGESISKSGLVVKANGEPAPTWIDKESGSLRTVLIKNGKKAYRFVHNLVANTFLPVPEELSHLGKRSIFVKFKDDNRANPDLENLYWTTNQAVQIRAFLERQERELCDIDYPQFDEVNTGLYPNAVECPKYPGWYFLPTTQSPVLINKQGQVFNTANKEPQLTSFNHKGYLQTSLWDGVRHNHVAIHRLLGMLFCPIPEHHINKTFAELEINHKDGVKTNNIPSNLEWVSKRENMLHAWESGLVPTEKPVLSRCIVTGEIIRYRSISELSRSLSLPPSAIFNHLKSPAAGRYAENNRVFKYDDGSDWPELLVQQAWNEVKKWARYVMVTNVITNDVSLYATLEHACIDIGIDLTSLKSHRQRHGGHVIYKNWLLILSHKLSGVVVP